MPPHSWVFDLDQCRAMDAGGFLFWEGGEIGKRKLAPNLMKFGRGDNLPCKVAVRKATKILPT